MGLRTIAWVLGSFVMLMIFVVGQMILLGYWRNAMEEVEQDIQLKEDVLSLQRLAVEIEDGSRSYLLTRQPASLAHLRTAEARLHATMQRVQTSLGDDVDAQASARVLGNQLQGFLESKQMLVRQVEQGREDIVSAYLQGGYGAALSATLDKSFRGLDLELEQVLLGTERQIDRLTIGLLQRLLVVELVMAVLGGLLVYYLLNLAFTRPVSAKA